MIKKLPKQFVESLDARQFNGSISLPQMKQLIKEAQSEETARMAAGIASTGKRVFVYSIGNFSTLRFEGFANDANFLGLFLIVSYCMLRDRLKTFWLVVLIFLVVLTMSRTAIACLTLLLVFEFIFIFSKCIFQKYFYAFD